MTSEYSVEVCRTLQDKFNSAMLHRPMRVARYDAGTELTYHVTGVDQAQTAQVRLVVENFVGGGFAGQVYRVKVLGIDAENGPICSLEPGGIYAMKILVPPSSFSRLFRDALYWIGFQGPFQLQVNPAAARAGALWQKFIRRGAKIKFGDERTVVDVHATFVDYTLGSCGELSEWIDGRTWLLEVDEHLDLLKLWRKGKTVDADRLGSPEYRAKRQFMADFVKLLHDMGGHEFARQYEWLTCKSQPNCLKRYGTEDNPSAGLVAVDFRAGLALLPFLPMSPGDFKLIANGLMRGSLVQFDRGDINKLQQFVDSHSDQFADMRQMLDELKSAEKVYRDSVPDITHNHIRLVYSGQLWSTILDSAITSCEIRNLIDEQTESNLRHSRCLTLLFLFVGLIPFLGRFIQRIWGHSDWRRHYNALLTSWPYLHRAIRAKIAEKLILWHRAGRVDANRALKLADTSWLFFCHLPFALLPSAGLHRFLTDWRYAKDCLAYFIVRPVRLYFNAHLREQWLREMVTEGQKKHMLTADDAKTILSRVAEPFIQKYLKALAVHVCTLPVTHIVSVMVAWIYIRMHPELSTAEDAMAIVGILILFQVIPVSPGSLVRGLYVLYLVIRERNFRDYNIAVFLGFFKYVGYLAFPIQMAYYYPVLARFMAAHWATEAVHIVPVFGERGALLEHGVFGLFYNWPLTIRRRMRNRAELRANLKPRYWHVVLCAIAAAAFLGLTDFTYFKNTGQLPGLKDIWWIAIPLPLLCGAWVTLGCGGAVLWRRFVAAAVCGMLLAGLYTVISATLGYSVGIINSEIAVNLAWRLFIFAILSTIGAIFTEIKLPEPPLS